LLFDPQARAQQSIDEIQSKKATKESIEDQEQKEKALETAFFEQLSAVRGKRKEEEEERLRAATASNLVLDTHLEGVRFTSLHCLLLLPPYQQSFSCHCLSL